MNLVDYRDYQLQHPLVPNSIYYVPDFISKIEENDLIDQVVRAPKPKWTKLSNRSLQVYGGYPKPEGMIAEVLPEWLQVYTKRLQKMEIFDKHLPNQVLINCYQPGQGIMAHEDGPLYFPTVATLNTGSHTVLNFYEKSTKTPSTRVTAMNDGETSSAVLGGGGDGRQYRFSLLLWPRSLNILKHQAYDEYLHEIEELHADEIVFPENLHNNDDHALVRGLKIINLDQIQEIQSRLSGGDCLRLPRQTRYSFTIRFVPKCHRIDLNRILFLKK